MATLVDAADDPSDVLIVPIPQFNAEGEVGGRPPQGRILRKRRQRI